MQGEAVPKKPFLKHNEFFTYNLFIFAIMATWWRRDWLAGVPFLQTILGPILGVAGAYLIWKWGPFTIFKLYPEGFGAGLNLYWKGWRVVGLDWHQWIMRQDVQTGKPLQPHEQYALNRPHIDLPLWEYHHWPWAQLPHSTEVAALTAVKKERRAAKAEKKTERKARREAQLQARALAAAGASASAPDSPAATRLDSGQDSSGLGSLLMEDDSDVGLTAASCPPTPLEPMLSPATSPVPAAHKPHVEPLSPLFETSSHSTKRMPLDSAKGETQSQVTEKESQTEMPPSNEPLAPQIRRMETVYNTEDAPMEDDILG